MRAKILIGLIFFSLMMPSMSLAASSDLLPEFNNLCWHKAECNATRAQILQKEVKDVTLDTSGWLQEDPCTGDWGKCLPSGITVTEIAFGGKNKFANLGDFLKTNYNIALTVAGILAVIMIIIAGVQWVTSGGNSEMISSAKKRIGGALIGLLIAYLSYTILATINPALINLRLPQNFLIRPFSITPQYCRDASASNASTTFALAAKKGEKVDPAKMKDPKLVMEAIPPEKMACGDNYFIGGGGSATCMGSACADAGKSCLPFTSNGDQIVNNNPNCESAQLAVHFTVDPTVKLKEFFTFFKDVEGQEWMNTNYDNPVWAVCEVKASKKLYIGAANFDWTPNTNNTDRKTFEVKKEPYDEYYLLINRLNPYLPNPGVKEEKWNCMKGDNIVGFVFKSQFFVNLNPVNSNFFVSSKYVGPWQSISTNGYITVDDLKKGVFIEAKINPINLGLMVGSKWTNPTINTIDGTQTGDAVFIGGSATQAEQDKAFQQIENTSVPIGGPN